MRPPAGPSSTLADVGIEDGARRLRQYPHELSGGMLQRVIIGAALLAEPKLLLADEPTTALDVTTQSEVMAILDELRRERGVAVLFITHDLELAASVCDRTCVMYAGEIVEQQSSSVLNASPLHPYTAALLAARPRLDGPVRRAGGDPRTSTVGVRGRRGVCVRRSLSVCGTGVHRDRSGPARSRGRARALPPG